VVRRWEYRSRLYKQSDIDSGKGGADVEVNALGREGWELVGVTLSFDSTSVAFWFKRELPPGSSLPN
jgi:hypothetical protein